MRRIFAAVAATAGALWIASAAFGAPSNQNSIRVGMDCDHGVGAITGASIAQNNAGALNIVDPGPGAYAVKRAEIDGQLVYENPGFAGRVDSLVRCKAVSFNGEALPEESPKVVWWGILTGP